MIYLLTHNFRLILQLSFYYLLRCLFRVYYIFPIKNDKIIFVSYGGNQYTCSPYAIYKELVDRYPNQFQIFWISKTQEKAGLRNCDELLFPKGLKYWYHVLTCTVLIDNDGLPPYIPFRKNQYVVNTWHGGGLFKRTYGNVTKSESIYVKLLYKMCEGQTKLFLSSCRVWSERVARRAFYYNGEILSSGMPRNDIFFKDDNGVVKKVKSYFKIKASEKIVLYAPTFRGGVRNRFNTGSSYNLDVERLIRTLEDREKCKYVFIYRGHHAGRHETNVKYLDATNYPDMQELMAAADVFISDYTSALWDFSLTKKPCFIFATDFDEYVISPGFESDYREWPFPISKSNEELVEKIKSFNKQDYEKAVDHYHELYGSYEKGNATDVFIKHLISVLSNIRK